MTYNIISTIITIVCTKWIIGSVPLQKYVKQIFWDLYYADFKFLKCAKNMRI